MPTAANDAGLVAQTLQAAGFEVVGARDLDADTLRKSYADFLKKVTDAGPDTVAFIYLSGYGLQYGNDNYYVPIGATVARDTDIPIESVRVSDLTSPLIAMNLKARFMVFDASYKTPFKTEGAPLAGGLSLVDASPGSLIAYNAAPGTIAPVAKGNYGLYAQSLAAMLREGGLAPDELFDRVRLRVNDQSKGTEVPWDASKIDTAFRFFVSTKGAPPPLATPDQVAALMTKPLKDLPVKEAYTAAVARDTVDSYQTFVASYPSDPLAKRTRVLLAARREALTWRQTDLCRRFARCLLVLSAALIRAARTPRTRGCGCGNCRWHWRRPRPSRCWHTTSRRHRRRRSSTSIVPVIYFDDPGYDFPPPPPPPDYWLPPVPVAFIDLPAATPAGRPVLPAGAGVRTTAGLL